MKIGVFDSGIGGQAVAARLQELIPTAEIISVNDHAHVPYGSRTPEDIITLTKTAIQPLITARCDVIVLACNTVTTVAISHLRSTYPDMNFVGIEPMIKPATELTKRRHIAVFATPATLASERYKELKAEWASSITVDEPDCSSWAGLIENDKSDEIPVESIVQSATGKGADVIVLACTHYHWLKQRIEKSVGPKITVLEPSDAVSRRIKSILNLAA